MSEDKKYLVEINDWAPDILEYREVEGLDWAKIAFQPEAYFFAFYEPGQPRLPISDWFYLTIDPRVLTAEEATAEFPEYADTVSQWAAKGVTEFANHAYDCGSYKGGRIIPLLKGCALIDRKAMTKLWPTAT